MGFVADVQAKLAQELNAAHVEIIDNSWQHAGHAGMSNVPFTEGTHLAMVIVSERFSGLGIMDQHRLVHQTLQAEMATRIHALELKTYTPERWNALLQASK
jgi:BolA protein